MRWCIREGKSFPDSEFEWDLTLEEFVHHRGPTEADWHTILGASYLAAVASVEVDKAKRKIGVDSYAPQIEHQSSHE
jgi:hypothetical protein